MFKDLSRFNISRATSWLDMPELGKNARIRLKPATEANPPYQNAMLKLSGKRLRQMARTDEITGEDAELNREDDRKLFPLHIVDGWEGIDGEPSTAKPGELDDKDFVVFTKKASTKLCSILPPHLFDRIRNHASTSERFYGDEPAPPDPVELAKNSKRGSSSN